MRLATSDDYLHEVESASNFNESRYYNFYAADSGAGGWLRMGNRPNEGYAEMTVCLYLPDGRIAFTYRRPEIAGHEAHDAGGLRFDVVAPFEEHRVTYAGKVLVLADPMEMNDPKAAFASNPLQGCTLDLTHRSVGRPWGGEPEWDDDEERPEIDPEKSFAKGHTEQHMAITGTMTVGEETFDLAGGLGLRDHSWGPRYWQAVWWYRWLTVNLGPDLGMAMTVAGSEEGGRSSHGFLYDTARYGDDRLVPIRSVELLADYDEHVHPRQVHATITTDDHTYALEGEVWSTIPLRNRREGMTTRITEGMTRWRCEGRVGSGMSEFLDQIVDGRPVGVDATAKA